MAPKQPASSAVDEMVKPSPSAGAKARGWRKPGAGVSRSKDSDLLYDWNALSPQVVSFESATRLPLRAFVAMRRW